MNDRLQVGDSGPTVSKMQKGLNGWVTFFGVAADPIEVNGQFGPATETLVKRYQAAAGLPETGVCGGIAYSSLMEYVPDRIDDRYTPTEFTARIVPIP